MFQIICRCKDILLDPVSRLEHDYMLGFKARPKKKEQPKCIIVDRVERETNWGAVAGAGLAGVLIGLALRKKSKKAK